MLKILSLFYHIAQETFKAEMFSSCSMSSQPSLLVVLASQCLLVMPDDQLTSCWVSRKSRGCSCVLPSFTVPVQSCLPCLAFPLAFLRPNLSRVAEFLSEWGVTDGLCSAFSPGITGALSGFFPFLFYFFPPILKETWKFWPGEFQSPVRPELCFVLFVPRQQQYESSKKLNISHFETKPFKLEFEFEWQDFR